MKTRLLIWLMLAIAIVGGMGPSAQAQWGGCGYGYGWDGGLGWLYQSLQYNVPYYAAFPPVYYSYPVPRTYGYSPFAYPPGVMTPDVSGEPAPVEIINPYVPSTKSAPAEKPQPDTTAAVNRQQQPLVIVNPYVSAGKALAQSER